MAPKQPFHRIFFCAPMSPHMFTYLNLNTRNISQLQLEQVRKTQQSVLIRLKCWNSCPPTIQKEISRGLLHSGHRENQRSYLTRMPRTFPPVCYSSGWIPPAPSQSAKMIPSTQGSASGKLRSTPDAWTQRKSWTRPQSFSVLTRLNTPTRGIDMEDPSDWRFSFKISNKTHQ